jgi:choline dehydrogenase-like flavoprotein
VNTHRANIYDFIIIGAGISGSFIAHELCRAGARCLLIEAGKHYTRQTYPRNDLDGTV